MPHRRDRAALLRIGLGLLWALPLTFFGGMLVAVPVLLTGGQCRRLPGALPAWLIQGKLGDYLLRQHPVGAVNAMAIGHLVIAQRGALSKRILLHELEHVRQATRWGVFFPLAYLAAAVVARLHGGDAYWNNSFEIAARRAEQC